MIPDAKELTAAYLRTSPDLQAIVQGRIGTQTPAETDRPWIRIRQVDDSIRVPNVLHLVAVYLQLDCYGGGDRTTAERESGLLARTAREFLAEMPAAQHDDAVVTAVRFGSSPDVPDPDFKPARERVALEATVYLHPA